MSNESSVLSKAARELFIENGNEIWEEDGKTYVRQPDGVVIQLVSSIDIAKKAYEILQTQAEDATVVATVARGVPPVEAADTPELKAYAKEYIATWGSSVPPVAHVEFKTADEILTWVADQVDAGEDVQSADVPYHRQIGFSIPGTWASIGLIFLRNGFAVSPDVAARFGQSDEFVKEAFSNAVGRSWIARGGKQSKESEPELDPAILREYHAILEAEAEELKPEDQGCIDEFVPRPGVTGG